MCTHLDKTGSTYYFRRPVPRDLIGQFITATGKARTEWKYSLGTKDREEARPELRQRRRKEEQTVTVVHVYPAGQAAIADTLAAGGGENREITEQSDASQTAFEGRAAWPIYARAWRVSLRP